MRSTKIALHALLLVCVTLLSVQVAYADTDEKTKIDKVFLSAEYTYDAGEYEVEVDTSNDDLEIKEWKVTEKSGSLLVEVKMIAETDYYFSSSSAAGFSVSGAKFVSASRSSSNTVLTAKLSIDISDVEVEISEPYNLTWKSTKATWASVTGATKYQATLYRDDEEVKTKKVTETSVDFTKELAEEGQYYYTVQAIAKSGELSDVVESPEQVVMHGEWLSNDDGWWYQFSDDSYPAGEWMQIDGIWYYFDQVGYMMTGWQFVDDEWYYLAEDGSMATGWWFINDMWYYLNESGDMAVDWQVVGDSWYYLGEDGAMLVDTMTPDGYRVDENGVWVQ